MCNSLCWQWHINKDEWGCSVENVRKLTCALKILLSEHLFQNTGWLSETEVCAYWGFHMQAVCSAYLTQVAILFLNGRYLVRSTVGNPIYLSCWWGLFPGFSFEYSFNFILNLKLNLHIVESSCCKSNPYFFFPVWVGAMIITSSHQYKSI